MRIKKITHERTAWVIVAGVELLLILGLVGWMGLSYWKSASAEKKKYQLPTMTVEAQPVEMGDYETFISTVGTLKANESVDIRAQDGGVIKEILFKSGTPVNKGETLIILDDQLLKANLAEAQARARLAKVEYERAENLFKKRAIPQSKRDDAKAKMEMADAQVEMSKVKLEQSILKAPFTGIIGLKDVSVGAYVKPAQEIVTLDNLNPIKIDFRISEIHLEKIKVGQNIAVEVDGFPHLQYTATIEAIDPIVDAAGHSIRARATMANPNFELKPGLFARIRFSESLHSNAMLVPESAIETEGNQEFVFVIVDGIARRAPIKTGGRNGKDVEVLSGLQPGMMVVTSGQMRIGEGFPVIVIPDKEKIGYK